ncbi:MAG: hypothetical protein K2Y23_09020 [Cyanobacteria bacterium]|nr:hypothetical protein [Cyanobacteriota bacterium]
MTPQAFSFKLTVPADPEGATIVAVMATHAVEYTKLDAAKGAAFVEKARAAAAHALKNSGGKHCQAVIAAANGQLTVTIGGQTVSESLPA